MAINNTNYRQEVKRLKAMSQAYYMGDSPIATDNEYDQLFKEVRVYEAAHPAKVDPLSPTQTVGAVVEGGFAFGEEVLGYGDLLAVQDIGEESARLYVEFMRKNEDYVSELVGILNPSFSEKIVLGNALNGKTICITGTLSRPRGEFKELAEAHGAKVSGSVSKNTDYLLAGENAGSKASKAVSLGIEIIDEDQFNTMIGKE